MTQYTTHAIDAGLAHAFEARRRQLHISKNVWLGLLISSTTLLLTELIVIFLPIALDPTITSIWYRLILTIPLLFFITFAAIQYNKERGLVEKYAFKAALALSLQGYTTLLMNTFKTGNSEEKICNFVLNTMTSIYNEPHEIIKESKFSVDFGGKFASLKADFTETMQETQRELVKSVKAELKKDEKAVG